MNILYESERVKTWKDVDGVMWKYNKINGNLYQYVKHNWKLVDTIITLDPDTLEPYESPFI